MCSIESTKIETIWQKVELYIVAIGLFCCCCFSKSVVSLLQFSAAFFKYFLKQVNHSDLNLNLHLNSFALVVAIKPVHEILEGLTLTWTSICNSKVYSGFRTLLLWESLLENVSGKFEHVEAFLLGVATYAWKVLRIGFDFSFLFWKHCVAFFDCFDCFLMGFLFFWFYTFEIMIEFQIAFKALRLEKGVYKIFWYCCIWYAFDKFQ